MIPTSIWLGSFFYLALVVAFVCTAVKEDDDAAMLTKTFGFFLVIAGATAAFCGLVLAVEAFL